MPRILIHFNRYGPYHRARLASADAAMAPLGWEVIGLETAGDDAVYAWDGSGQKPAGPRVITAFPGRIYEEIDAASRNRIFPGLLDALDPDVIAVAGWSAWDAQSCLSWCRKMDRRAILMSETRAADGRRVWWKEWIKRWLISRYHGALVGGQSHADYLVRLGMDADEIQFGYNVVDNDYFSAECERWRRDDGAWDRPSGPGGVSAAPAGYFLASNRFVARKNLARLIEGYAILCREVSADAGRSKVPALCLLGDGELKSELIGQCLQAGLEVAEGAPWEEAMVTVGGEAGVGRVYFPGFRQVGELPRFFAHAMCFVHPALEEPWGLVINEAMACGLPVLSGSNVGAAGELVEVGKNGWIFDAADAAAIAVALGRILQAPPAELRAMGLVSRRILADKLPTEAFGKGLLALLK